MRFGYILPVISWMLLCLYGCEKEYGPRKESTPQIEKAEIRSNTFTFGETIHLMARISDPATSLTVLEYEIFSENKLIATGEIPLSGEEQEIEVPIFVPLLKGQKDQADVQIHLTARNILKGSTEYVLEGLTGNRPHYDELYLVLDDNAVIPLIPESENSEKYAVDNLTLDPVFNFKIAEKIDADHQIDFEGSVFGNLDGKISMIEENGGSVFSYTADADYVHSVVFDLFDFSLSTTGSRMGESDLALSAFQSTDINGEVFQMLPLTLEKGKVYNLFGRLADPENIYNLDFFRRIADNQIEFLGETGEYTLYFNPVRKNMIIGVENPAYPEFLLGCGWGLGYPTHVSAEKIGAAYPGHHLVHTDWGFDHVMKFVLLRSLEPGIFQGTFMMPGEHDHYAQFKFYENSSWGNEKQAGDFEFHGEKIISGDNDWLIPNGEDDPKLETGIYRMTIDLNENSVFIEKITL